MHATTRVIPHLNHIKTLQTITKMLFEKKYMALSSPTPFTFAGDDEVEGLWFENSDECSEEDEITWTTIVVWLG